MTVASVLRGVKHKTRIRTRFRDARKKTKTIAYIYRTNGTQGLKMYVKDGLKKRLKKNTPINETGDVLIVSINDPLLDRYRTDHMVEALESTGASVGKVFYYELKPEHIKHYNVFIFYRCPWLPQFEEAFKEIKKKNKVSIYAVDDLVVDTKYTDTLPVVQALIPEDRAVYDDGVRRHGELMRHCDYAVTTTQALADELGKYKNLKEVFIDRNTMSDEMVHFADKALKEVVRDDEKTVIGYFSGTSTHNEDFQMVAPALVRILEEHQNVYIKLAGRIDAPEQLKAYEDRLIYTPYVDWRRLPFELRACDINLSPLVDTLFNRSKSEIKWSESALVGVPAVASDIGAFREVVKNGVTGMLVENTEDAWYEAIRQLVEDESLRQRIGKQAREDVLANSRTTGEKAVALRQFIDRVTPPIVAFGGVNISAISGGNIVIKKHMDVLQEAGNIVYGVESMDYHENDKWQALNDTDDKKYDIFRINSHRKSDKVHLKMNFDKFVATFWGSAEMVDFYPHMKNGGKKYYLVQGMEAGFYGGNETIRRKVLATYRNHRLQPITISKWCQDWLASDFGREAKYAPNGIELEKFPFHEREWSSRKIKVLVEGDSASEYKRVDESFRIANRLDRDKFEVSYLSYNAEPKEWYKVDHIYLRVPFDKVGALYAEHDILIKSSVLESFSYPPLEIMATGGVPVLVKNGGNAEYVIDRENAVYYDEADIDDALEKIDWITKDPVRFGKIAKKGQKTAKSRAWHIVKQSVVDLYE